MKEKIHKLNAFTNPVQRVGNKVLKKKMYQLPSLKFQDEPQIGKALYVGMESNWEKLLKNI